MRITLLIILSCLTNGLFCQQNLSSEMPEPYGLIYNLSTEEAAQMAIKGAVEAEQLDLFQRIPFDTVRKAEDIERLPHGFYVSVKLKELNLTAELILVQDLEIKLIPHKDFLELVFAKKDSFDVRPTNTYWNKKRLRYDDERQSFRVKTNKRHGVIRATYNKKEYLFPLVDYSQDRFFRRVGKKTLNFLPIKIVTKPFIDIYKSIRYNYPHGTVEDVFKIFNPDLRSQESSYGYIAVNKPIYKPNDTVFYKLKLAKRNGKPLNKAIELNLGSYSNNKLKTVIQLKKGEANGFIHLHDSLNLQLDERYWLTVEHRYKQLAAVNLSYEDYDLKSENYQVLVSKEVHGIQPNMVTLIGKDENDQRLRNVKYTVEIELREFYPDLNASTRLVPHTLLKSNGLLSSSEDTEVAIPDSIFQGLNSEYDIVVSFLNASNDRQVIRKRAEFGTKLIPVELKLEKDSILFELPEDDNTYQTLLLDGYTQNWDLDTAVTINTDQKVRLNPAIENYRLSTKDGKLSREFSMYAFDAQVNYAYKRDAKSVSISIKNPRKVPIWYSLYLGKALYEEGQTQDSLSLELPASKNQPVALLYKYLWAGEIQSFQEDLPYYKNLLTLTVDHQKLILPGITDTIRVKALDQKHRPVKGVDITAFSFTSKFKNDNVPDVPYFGKYKYINFSSRGFSEFYRYNHSIGFNYSEWKNSLNLDSNLFYQLAFPENMVVETLRDTIQDTYVSILPVNNGQARPVYYILMDGEPIYLNLSNQKDEIAHKISSGYHDFKIRTSESLITIDSIFIPYKKHTIISIAKGATHHKVLETFGEKKRQRWPLTSEEIDVLHGSSIRIVNAKKGIRYIMQGSKVFVPSSSRSMVIAGPLKQDSLSVFLVDNTEVRLYFQPGYNYEIIGNQIFRKAYQSRGFYPSASSISEVLNFDPDGELSKEVNPPIKWNRNNPVRLSNFDLSKSGKGVLSIYPKPDNFSLLQEFLIINTDNYSIARKLKSNWQQEYDEGNYALISILDSGFIRNDFTIKESHTTIINPIMREPIRLDSLYRLLNIEIVESKTEKIRPPIITVPSPKLGTEGMISGIVTGSDDGLPLPQVSIFIKNTNQGIATNADGTYAINIPPGYNTLVFRYIGYVTQEVSISNDKIVDVTLEVDATSLGEVVVTAQGIATQRSILTSLNGVVAGLQVESESLDPRTMIQVRGNSSVQSPAPLIIVDGTVVATLNDIDPSIIVNYSTLKGSSAIALYGSQAANGVLIVTTNKKSLRQVEEAPSFTSDNESEDINIRENFRDYAFWQPSAKTDKNGIATFVVTYPEDITSWQSHFIAMDNSGKTGQLKTTTKAYKPLVARLRSPRFLTEGDQSTLFGEVANYSGSQIDISRKFTVSGLSQSLPSTSIDNSYLDSVQFNTTGIDSIEVSYSLKSNALSDGERLSIPVSPIGLKKEIGEFHILSSDTVLAFKPKYIDKPVLVSLQSDLLGLSLDNVKALDEYNYWCNEQAASKLIALLAEKKISSKLSGSFSKKGKVNQAIRKLRRGVNDQDVWGWWEGMKTSFWVTNHAIRALYEAQKALFYTKVELDKSIAQLRNELPEMNHSDLLLSLETILLIDSSAQVEGYLNMLKQKTNMSLTERIRLTKMQLMSGMTDDISWLDSLQNKSLFDGLYFKDSVNDLRNNNITATLAAYELIKMKNVNDPRLASIRKYLMLNSKGNNTYALSNILMTIGGDIEATKGRDNISINGKKIDEFPFIQSYQENNGIEIKKTTNTDTYISFTQSSWESKPEIENQLGNITNILLDEGLNEVTELKSGETYTMRISINLNEDANYLMIEAPLIGGLQYASKPEAKEIGAYREYFQEKSNLYFESLKAGKYYFDIPLIARFPGEYTLNPAQMNLMYAPLISSNSAIKRLSIK